MQGDLSRWCKECIPCQVSKVTKHTIPPLREMPVPSRRFTEVNLDIVGPLPPLQGFSYLLTMIDRNTRWYEVTELDEVTATTVVPSLTENLGVQVWSPRDHGHGPPKPVYRGVVVHNV